MLAVIFEVWPATDRKDEYLRLAGDLLQEVRKIDGFLSVERFESLYEPGKLLSLQFWRDEKALAAWRTHLEHRHAQTLGRGGMFMDYRLRVAEIVRDYGPHDREQVLQDDLPPA